MDDENTFIICFIQLFDPNFCYMIPTSGIRVSIESICEIEPINSLSGLCYVYYNFGIINE